MIYEYECLDCKNQMTAFRKMADRGDCPECVCGGATKQVILSAPLAWVQPECHYLCHATGERGKPREVTSWRQRRNLMAEHNMIDANEICAPPDEPPPPPKAPELPPELVDAMKREGKADLLPKGV